MLTLTALAPAAGADFPPRLAEATVEADEALRDFSNRALVQLALWVEVLDGAGGKLPDGKALANEAEALRLRQHAAPQVHTPEPLPQLPAAPEPAK